MTALLRSPVAAHRSDVMMSDPANPRYRIHRSARRPCSGGSPCWWSGVPRRQTHRDVELDAMVVRSDGDDLAGFIGIAPASAADRY